MTDVLERLRADNPVPTGSPPSFEEVWERVQRRPTRRTRVLLLASVATVPVVLVAVIALVALGHRRPSGGTGAPAPAATLLHYRVQSLYGFGPSRSGGGFVYEELSAANVWVSGASFRLVASGAVFNSTTGRPLERQLRETAADAHRSETWSASSLAGKGTLEVGPAQMTACPGPFFNPSLLTGLSEFCGAAFRDPAGALRQLYDRRELAVVGRGVAPPGLSGRRLDELKLPYPGWVVEVFVRPGTFIPVMVIASRSPSPPPGIPAQRIVATITDYQRLPLTGANRGLLQMRPHPGATVVCANPGTGIAVRVTYPCSVRSPVAATRHSHTSRRTQPLPAALVRAFSVFRGMVSEQARAIPNHIGEQIWVVPETYQTCFKFSFPSHTPTGVGNRGGGGDCVPNSMALAGQFSPASFGRGETVVGLAPNGNATVKLTLRDGATETVPVSHNVYAVHTSRIIQTVTLKDSSGVLRTWNVPDGGP